MKKWRKSKDRTAKQVTSKLFFSDSVSLVCPEMNNKASTFTEKMGLRLLEGPEVSMHYLEDGKSPVTGGIQTQNLLIRWRKLDRSAATAA